MRHAAGARPVATRSFRTETGEEVTATLYEPVQVGDDEWTCEFRVAGASHDITGKAPGVDALQALIIGLQGLRWHLERLGEVLTWSEEEPGTLGIPRPIPDSFGVDVEERLHEVVEEELTRLVREELTRRSRKAGPDE